MKQAKRRQLLIATSALMAAPFAAVLAQQAGKVWRSGMLETTSQASNAANLDGFRQGMLALGYAEGRNYVIEYRSADGSNARFPELAAELVRAKVDLIVTRGTPATLAARKASSTIPIVTTATGEPLLVVASLARPGGNVTGLTAINTELQGKRVELLRAIFPRLSRLAGMGDMSNPASMSAFKELERKSQPLGIQPLFLDVRKREDFAPAFDQAARERVGAVMVSQGSLVSTHAQLIVALGAKHRIPVAFHSREFVVMGGLISYGVNYPDQYRRAAAYLDKIFKGAKPGDLPMEQPTILDLAINLKTAKTLGITIPQSILLRADQVIE